MAGLFGVIVLDPIGARLDAAALDTFDQMAGCLSHHPGNRTERHIAPGGTMAVGRVGPPHVNLVPWPAGSAPAPFGNVQSFYAGVLHNLSGELTATELPDAHGLRRLSGFYSCLYHHGTAGTAMLVVDRRGAFPIFHVQSGHYLYFASEIKALLLCPGVSREIDPEALSNFLAAGFLLADQTLFRSIRRLRGGRFLLVQHGRVAVHTYWNYAPGCAVDSTQSESELRDGLAELVVSSTERNLGDPDKTVIFLSGGYDTRGLLASAVRILGGDGSRLRTITWGATEGPEHSDVAVARRVAAALGVTHAFERRDMRNYGTDFEYANYLVDGLSAIPAEHPTEYGVIKQLHDQGCLRVLRGDETLGYSYPARTQSGAQMLGFLRRYRDGIGMSEWVQQPWHALLQDASEASIQTAFREVDGWHPDNAKDYLYFSHRFQGYLNTAGYFKQFLVDQRNVLLDERILDYMAQVPPRLRIDKVLYREAMAQVFPELWRIPFATTHNLEDWTLLLGSDTPVRAYVREQLQDVESGVWEYVNLGNLRAGLQRLEAAVARRSPTPTRRQRARGAVKRAFYTLPGAVQLRVQGWRATRPRYPASIEVIIPRVLVLKHWHDCFVSERRKPFEAGVTNTG